MTTFELMQSIFEREIKKLSTMSKESEGPLPKEQADILNNYMKSMLNAKKDERDASRGEGLEQLADDDLENLAKQALKTLGELANG